LSSSFTHYLICYHVLIRNSRATWNTGLWLV